MCYLHIEKLCGLFRATPTFRHTIALLQLCYFFARRTKERNYEKNHPTQRNRISRCDNTACPIRRYAHDVGIRTFYARCARVYIEPYSRYRVRHCGIYRARRIDSFVLHHRKAVQCGISIFVYILPSLRRNTHCVAKNPLFQHRCQPARKLRNVAKSASLYLRRFSHVLLRRTVFQGVFAPASLRLFRKRHK